MTSTSKAWTGARAAYARFDDSVDLEGGDDMARIRNGQLRRDFKRLLAIIADSREPDYAEVEHIAKRNGLYYDEKGEVKEERR